MELRRSDVSFWFKKKKNSNEEQIIRNHSTDQLEPTRRFLKKSSTIQRGQKSMQQCYSIF